MSKRCPSCGRPFTRTHAQNARLWALLHRLSERYRPAGETYSPDVWHHFLKSMFLGCIDRRLPDGRVVAIPRSSTDLDIGEMADYLTQVEAWCAERGVYLDEAVEAA